MREAIAQAIAAIRANRLRSSLGALAIAAAVATIVIVVTALDGVRRYAEATTARTFGSDTFLIAQVASPGRVSRRELREQLARNPPIVRSDLAFLYRYAGDDVIYAPNAQARADVSRGSLEIEDVSITGTTSILADIRDLNIVDGRFFRPDEDQRGTQVAVIGADVADALFPNTSPLGLPIRIAGRAFLVIGVQGRIGNTTLDKYVWMPLSAHSRAFGTPRSLQIFAKSPQGDAQAAEDHARVSLRAARQLGPGVSDTFDVLAPEAARGFVANLSQRIGAAATPISLMALLAAIVVVTNTVLVSVTQRTREIGVRRAVGATRAQITNEILAESVVLAVGGGVAGVSLALLL
ncbi:MAG TPA: ABC transporter permease, partial [Vicinamibacterales bacterium]|nr:ABC transporter permease [Vicinamibacterales bacterium]